MILLGRKSKPKAKRSAKTRQRKAKAKTKKVKIKLPGDVRLSYIMPVLVVLGFILTISGVWMVHRNSAAYKAAVMQSSMTYGTPLPLWDGDSRGTLSLGHTELSKDKKTLAVEVVYGDTSGDSSASERAHALLSSFGDNYRIWLVDTENNRMDVKIDYGLIGTDGSGVLTVHNEKGFANKAFVVVLIDKKRLVDTSDTSADPTNDTTEVASDEEVDKTFTAQLSARDDTTTDSSSTTPAKKRSAAFTSYYIRLNPYSAKASKQNWTNDADKIEDLIRQPKIASLKAKRRQQQQTINKYNGTLAEMKARKAKNKDDQVAKTNIPEITKSIANLELSIAKVNKDIAYYQNNQVKASVLQPKQTKYKHYTLDNLDKFK